MQNNFFDLTQYKNMADDKVVELIQAGDVSALNFIDRKSVV